MSEVRELLIDADNVNRLGAMFNICQFVLVLLFVNEGEHVPTVSRSPCATYNECVKQAWQVAQMRPDAITYIEKVN